MTGPSVRQVLEPEARILLAAAERRVSDEQVGADLADVRDWESLFGLAVRERALGPLWTLLSRFEDRLPPEFRENLEQAAALERIRQLRLERRLRDSVGDLAEAGITPMLLKGAAFLRTLYKDSRDRPMLDIDLLVPAAEIDRAREVLLAGEWRWDREKFPEEMYRRHYHLPPLVDSANSGIVLELHEGLFIPGHPLAFGPEDLVARAERIDVDGRPALVPHPVDHLVYVCLHFAWSHTLGSGGWRTLRDVARLVEAESFRWDDLVRRAKSADGSLSVYWTLRLQRDLIGGEVPQSVLDALGPPLPEPVLLVLTRHYVSELFPTGTSCPSLRLRQLLWSLGNRWVRNGEDRLSGRGSVRPWEYSDDFRSPRLAGAEPDRGMKKLGRHLEDRGRWREYLRRTLFPTSRTD